MIENVIVIFCNVKNTILRLNVKRYRCMYLCYATHKLYYIEIDGKYRILYVQILYNIYFGILMNIILYVYK